ncbi:HBL/NHE enterotoxin family protein [Chengkuizengella sp. SCS-71B]|uniref:HBL/NHE enterotoxin family protein n=1 Tax=Chengkuizengella sp. SCS-71B TaxID=3115290 RepID=UPI0032C247EB
MNKLTNKVLSIVIAITLGFGTLFSPSFTVSAADDGITGEQNPINLLEETSFHNYVEVMTTIGFPSWAQYIPNADIHISAAKNSAKSWETDIKPHAVEIIHNVIAYEKNFISAYNQLVELSNQLDDPNKKTEFLGIVNVLQKNLEDHTASVNEEHNIIDNFKKLLRDVDRANFQIDYNYAVQRKKDIVSEITDLENKVEDINRKYNEKKLTPVCDAFGCRYIEVPKYDKHQLDLEKAKAVEELQNKKNEQSAINTAIDQLEKYLNVIDGAYKFLDHGLSGLENQWNSLFLKFERILEIVTNEIDIDSFFLISFLNDAKLTWDDILQLAQVIEIKMDTFKSKVLGCSIPWGVDNLPFEGEIYYTLYDGNPTEGGLKVGKFAGTELAITLSSELYDMLEVIPPDQALYAVQEILVNGESFKLDARPISNPLFETSFLFSESDFKGDCITVSKGQTINLNQTGYYNFDNKLSSMVVKGNVYVSLFAELNSGGSSQRVFTDEDGYAQVSDFGGMFIGSDTVSSINVSEKKDGVYTFDGANFSGSLDIYNDEQFAKDTGGLTANDWMGYQRGDTYFKKDDSISSVKVIGPYAAALYENYNWSGAFALVKEDFGGPNLDSNIDNKASSISIFHGEGIWFFDIQSYRGNYNRVTADCSFSPNCGFPNDTLSSVLIIGDYGVRLYEHADYQGREQLVINFDQYTGSSGDIGDNLMSSWRIIK